MYVLKAVQETFIKNDYLLAVFIDLEKAYDMVWRRLVLKILLDLGLKGHLPKFIENFLKNRKIRVRIGDILSQSFDLENGLPQGSVLSCLLFSLVINSIFEELSDDIKRSLFCDDGKIWVTGPNLEDVVAKMQTALFCIEDWCNLHGPKISLTKTHYNFFTRKPNPPDQNLMLNGIPLQRQKLLNISELFLTKVLLGNIKLMIYFRNVSNLCK